MADDAREEIVGDTAVVDENRDTVADLRLTAATGHVHVAVLLRQLEYLSFGMLDNQAMTS